MATLLTPEFDAQLAAARESSFALATLTTSVKNAALEAIAAREAGMEILGLSLITNLAAGIQKEPLSHAEVLQAGKDAEVRISALLAEIIAKL